MITEDELLEYIAKLKWGNFQEFETFEFEDYIVYQVWTYKKEYMVKYVICDRNNNLTNYDSAHEMFFEFVQPHIRETHRKLHLLEHKLAESKNSIPKQIVGYVMIVIAEAVLAYIAITDQSLLAIYALSAIIASGCYLIYGKLHTLNLEN